MKNLRQSPLFDRLLVVITLVAGVLGWQGSTHAIPLTSFSWTTDIVNNASASVDGSNNVALRVYKDSWASAIAHLGNLDGRLSISFDYTTRSDGWWESPGVSIAADGIKPFLLQTCSVLITPNPTCAREIGRASGTHTGLDPTDLAIVAYGTVGDQFLATLDVTGATDLVFFIVPSWAALNGDHFNTYFNASNLLIDYTPTTQVPEPGTLALLGIALFGAGMVRRHRR